MEIRIPSGPLDSRAAGGRNPGVERGATSDEQEKKTPARVSPASLGEAYYFEDGVAGAAGATVVDLVLCFRVVFFFAAVFLPVDMLDFVWVVVVVPVVVLGEDWVLVVVDWLPVEEV
ncbi:MAG: hypothetical protein ABJC61_03350 [Acidobacteriota bacterium]